VDGQSITDQQSKVFSNQIPADSIQSIEVHQRRAAGRVWRQDQLGDVATTRSGQGITKPTGNISSSYGSFGSGDPAGLTWPMAIEVGQFHRGRRPQQWTLSRSPEFTVFHDKGNEQNIFDRVDSFSNSADSIHLDMNYSRSWFQTPNSFDNLNVQNVETTGPNNGSSSSPDFVNVGNTDQRSKIETINISPTYTRENRQ